MSHFTVMVIGQNPETQLAPFDENIEMPRYVKYTKEQLIENEKRDFERYRDTTYAKFLANKEEYLKDCGEGHSNYIQNEFPKRFTWTDEDFYKEAIEFYTEDEITPDGGVYSTANPNSQWDWYEIGGRWAGSIKLKEGVTPMQPVNFSWGWQQDDKQQALKENIADCALIKDIANLNELKTFAVLKDGQWYERGKMGWWGIVSDESDKDVWDSKVAELLAGLPEDTLISIYDCHI